MVLVLAPSDDRAARVSDACGVASLAAGASSGATASLDCLNTSDYAINVYGDIALTAITRRR
jgi:hypothetical protein